MAKAKQEVVIVIEDRAIRVPRNVWDLFHRCAGQMIQDGDHFDYYKSAETKKTLEAVSTLYQQT